MKIKSIIILISVIGVLGISFWILNLPRSGFALDTFKIGYVDINKALEAHPDIDKARSALNSFALKTKDDYQKQLDAAIKDKSANEAQQIKADYEAKLNAAVAKKWQDLLSPMLNDIEQATKNIAKAKGIDIVLKKDSIIYGGIDITDDVIKAIRK
ncbi:MAG: OmpH family outer membrane protein [bacterium]